MKKYKFSIKGHEYEVEILSFEHKVAELEVNGTHYTVEVQLAGGQTVQNREAGACCRAAADPGRIQDTAAEFQPAVTGEDASAGHDT